MTDVYVLRVFTDPGGQHGNPLGVVLDTTGLDDGRRQAIAAELSFSETVFVDDVANAELRIFTPALELPLAGHPLVGTSWLLTRVSGAEVRTLRPLRATAEVQTWNEGELTWIRARVDDAPPWQFTQLPSPTDVDGLQFPPAPDQDGREFWAWQDEAAGLIRARFFAPIYGVPEDEATGSAALRLVSRLGRPIVIAQGRGSIIHARPAADPAYAEIGGRVIQDELRQV
jgi:predicted PhzF superfamily epimerase YddE/YHI9